MIFFTLQSKGGKKLHSPNIDADMLNWKRIILYFISALVGLIILTAIFISRVIVDSSGFRFQILGAH